MTVYGDILTEQKIRNGKIDLKNPSEEDFYDLIDLRFDFNDKLDETIFQYQNFFPHDKSVTDGKWIKVPTDVGFNVYYAKPSRKIPNETNITRKVKKLQKQVDNETDIDKKLKLAGETVKLTGELLTARYLDIFAYDLKYARIRTSKSKLVHLLPHEYEVVNADIEEYIAAMSYSLNKGAVKFKHIFSSENEEQVFYLRSRGIPKHMAILMADLKNAYFVVNTQELFDQTMQFVQPENN